MKEQHRNKRSNVWYQYKGKKYIQKDILKLLGLNYQTMRNRKKKGWPLHKVFGDDVEEIQSPSRR